MNETPYEPPGSYWGLLGVLLGSYSSPTPALRELDAEIPRRRDTESTTAGRGTRWLDAAKDSEGHYGPGFSMCNYSSRRSRGQVYVTGWRLVSGLASCVR